MVAGESLSEPAVIIERPQQPTTTVAIAISNLQSVIGTLRHPSDTEEIGWASAVRAGDALCCSCGEGFSRLGQATAIGRRRRQGTVLCHRDCYGDLADTLELAWNHGELVGHVL